MLAKLDVAPLSELSSGSAVPPDAEQLMLASIGSADASGVITALGDYKGDASGDLTAEVLSTAIKLAGGHTSYALPAGVSAQNVIDEFSQPPLNGLTGFTVPTQDQLILTLANAADTDTLADVATGLANRGVTGITSEVLSAAVNVADVGGHDFPKGVSVDDVIDGLSDLNETVDRQTLIIAIASTQDTDGNGSIDLEDVVLRNTSNSPVDLAVLQAAVNFNDESWDSLWVSLPDVDPEDIVAQLDVGFNQFIGNFQRRYRLRMSGDDDIRRVKDLDLQNVAQTDRNIIEQINKQNFINTISTGRIFPDSQR